MTVKLHKLQIIAHFGQYDDDGELKGEGPQAREDGQGPMIITVMASDHRGFLAEGGGLDQYINSTITGMEARETLAKEAAQRQAEADEQDTTPTANSHVPEDTADTLTG